ncbi:MAG: HutP family protein [Limnochordales bacterium]|nr:HutP family protein [Limnochordales bacterium]
MSQTASRVVARAALEMALTWDRDEEAECRAKWQRQGVAAAAVDFGGPFESQVPKVIERAIVAARREGVIGDSHGELGAVAGAAHEAMSQLSAKAVGLNVGGKAAICRQGDHLVVAVVASVGLVHLDDVAVGLGHRVAVSGCMSPP